MNQLPPFLLSIINYVTEIAQRETSSYSQPLQVLWVTMAPENEDPIDFSLPPSLTD